MRIKRLPRAGASNHDCGKPSPETVVFEDRNGQLFTLGSIVEIIPWDGKAMARGHLGLWYVREFVHDENARIRARIARTNHDKWELSVLPVSLSLRCFKPHRGKGE